MPSRRPAAVVCAGIAGAVIVGVLLVVLLRGGEHHAQGVADPLAEALAYAPASSSIVLEVDGRGSQQRKAADRLVAKFPAGRFIAGALTERLAQAGLRQADIDALLQGPVVVAGPDAVARSIFEELSGMSLSLETLLDAGGTAAVVGRNAGDVDDAIDRAVDDRRLRRNGTFGDADLYAFSGGELSVRSSTVVVGPDVSHVRQALRTRQTGGGMTRASFLTRLGPLRDGALIRGVLHPRVVLTPDAGGTPWVDALRDGAFSIRLEDPGVRLRVHLATDPTRLSPNDLPLASGSQPPRPAPGAARASVGIRGLSQTLDAFDRSRNALRLPLLQPFTKALDTLDHFKGPLRTFGGIDLDKTLLDQLTGTTTITAERNGNAIRAELKDGHPLRTALSRLASIPDVAINLTGVTDLDIDGAERHTYELRRDGRTFLRIAIINNILVTSTDLGADLQGIARRQPEPAPDPNGALSGRATAAEVQDRIVSAFQLPGVARLALGGFGDLTFSAHAELTGLDLRTTLELNT